MNKFALIEVNAVKGKIKFFKLDIDGHCPFDEFIERIQNEGNLKKYLPAVFSIMDQIANLQLLPQGKFKDITPKNDPVKEYEIKKNELRIYLIKSDGHIIILGGKKGNQKKDIARFRSIKKEYIESK
jgi:putative component of toxin-antitoxin plasmid stabilization module